jgi:hypothetical protein
MSAGTNAPGRFSVDKRTILIQLDSDLQPSVFDRVVAVDAGADEVFTYGGVRPEQVRDLVHGAIFTRGPKDLNRTAIFIGGSDVAAGERLLEEVRRHMIAQFGLRVSVLFDANGANTTAAAAVRAAGKHLALGGCSAAVLGGSGPVGQRLVRLLAREGAEVRVCSRQEVRARTVCEAIRAKVNGARVEPWATGTSAELQRALAGQKLIIAAGAAGVLLLPRSIRAACPELRVAIDLNAVPPLGIEEVEAVDKGVERNGVQCYGAVGIGGTKMKIHKAAIARLFESNDQVLDVDEVYALAQSL